MAALGTQVYCWLSALVPIPPRKPATPAIVRRLTPGELRFASSLFNSALNISLVRVHNKPWFAGQGRHTAMTPNGEVYFQPWDYQSDFSAKIENAAWLMHELTHALQYQSGRSVKVRGFLEQAARLIGGDPYRYGQLDRDRPFDSYMNEQQAMIVEDYFRLTHGLHSVGGAGSLDDYRTVIPFAPKRFFWTAPRSRQL